MNRGDILLVDDDPDLLKLISLRLTSAGYRVRTADSGETALATIAVERPSTVITDLRMPGIDGLQLFEAIHRQHPALPVIILTAHDDAHRAGSFRSSARGRSLRGRELHADPRRGARSRRRRDRLSRPPSRDGHRVGIVLVGRLCDLRDSLLADPDAAAHRRQAGLTRSDYWSGAQRAADSRTALVHVLCWAGSGAGNSTMRRSRADQQP